MIVIFHENNKKKAKMLQQIVDRAHFRMALIGDFCRCTFAEKGLHQHIFFIPPLTFACLSVSVYGHDFVQACSKKWVNEVFLKFLFTHYLLSEDVHLEYSY